MLQTLKVAVVGLGYAGLPLAVAFNQKYAVVGYDADAERIQALTLGLDVTNEVNREEFAQSTIFFTADPADIAEAGFVIIAVPPAIDEHNLPDLTALNQASRCVGEYMKKGAVVVYESLAAPGMIEEICIPLLEKYSGYESGKEFFAGYSSSRILAGEKTHRFLKTKKVVAGQNEEVTEFLAQVYGSVVGGGIHKAPSIRVAETANLIEHIQCDVNVALMNELAMICEELKIDTQQVLETAGSRRGFVKAAPNLVGGQGIELASFYLAGKVQSVGERAGVILSSRAINESMGRFVAQALVEKLIQNNISLINGRVIILGVSVKEEVPDLRNSKVMDIVKELRKHGLNVQISDPYASKEEAEKYFNSALQPFQKLQPAHAVILAVPHKPYKENGWKQFESLLIGQCGIVFDIKSVLDAEKKPEKVQLWRL